MKTFGTSLALVVAFGCDLLMSYGTPVPRGLTDVHLLTTHATVMTSVNFRACNFVW